MKNILQVKDLTLHLDEKPILEDLNIDFWREHIHAIVGPNGAGKSTLAHAIMGLPGYTHFEGDILFQGESITSLSIDERARKGISLAWQEPARFEGVSIKTFVLAAGGDNSKKGYQEAMRMVGLGPEKYEKRAVDKTLSGGERKRIELASIIAMQPQIVLMDEPDSGVDIDAVQNIFDAINHLKEQGTTIILITHSSEVLKQADHAFLLCDGQLVDKGTISKLSAYFEGKCVPCKHKNQPNIGKEEPE